jgi:hypothetical protein
MSDVSGSGLELVLLGSELLKKLSRNACTCFLLVNSDAFLDTTNSAVTGCHDKQQLTVMILFHDGCAAVGFFVTGFFSFVVLSWAAFTTGEVVEDIVC